MVTSASNVLHSWEAAFEVGWRRGREVEVRLGGRHQGALGHRHVVADVAAVAPVDEKKHIE